MDASIEAAVAGRAAFPSRTAFIGADMDGFGEAMARLVRQGRPILVVYPDGDEHFLEPRRVPDRS
jgi:hypothetical protein